MKVVNKKCYFFEQSDKKFLKKWLIEHDLSQLDFAKNCGISVSYLTFIINGQRQFSEKIKKLFENQGLVFDLGE